MVRINTNKTFKKETVNYQDLDILEKLLKLSRLQGVIAIMENNLATFKSKSNDDKKIKEVEAMITNLKEVEAYVYLLWEKGTDAEGYAFRVTKINTELQFKLQQLQTENNNLKNNI